MKKIAFIVGLILLGTLQFLLPVGLMAWTVPRARYISLAPSTTEILFAWGLDEEIGGFGSKGKINGN